MLQSTLATPVKPRQRPRQVGCISPFWNADIVQNAAPKDKASCAARIAVQTSSSGHFHCRVGAHCAPC